MKRTVFLTLCCAVVMTASHAQAQTAGAIDLPTSKQLLPPVPGSPQRVNSLPISTAVSPDGHWVVSLNAGFGTRESGYMQSLAVVNTSTGEVRDFPDQCMSLDAQQTFFSGLAFSIDGSRVYASVGSTTSPDGTKPKSIGNGVAVYSFADGVLKPERFLKLPLVKLPVGKVSTYGSSHRADLGVPFPAAIAVIPGAHERLLVAENLSDSVAIMDAQTGAVERTFDVSENANVPSTYPVALAVTPDGRRAFVALWNSSEIVELDLVHGTAVRKLALLKPHDPTDPGSHPCALLLDSHTGLLYVALSNRDAVAAVRTRATKGKTALQLAGYFDTRLPGQSYFGAEPDALAESADGRRLYAANLGSDAIAVLETKRLKPTNKAHGMTEPIGFIPTELMPTALVASGGTLYIATDKGKGTGRNDNPQPLAYESQHVWSLQKSYTYAPTLLYGSLAAVHENEVATNLERWTREVLESNRMRAEKETIQFAAGRNPIRHVIYIIKENRSYDQVFGDLRKDGEPVGNGDPKLTMYGSAITPNEHKLALQFGVLDNFYDSGEVSGDGHVWSTAGIGTDYLEKTWQQNYRGTQRTYDYEGVVADGYPLLQHIPDVNEPASKYLWSNLAAHGKSIYHFGEYVSSVFCGEHSHLPRSLEADPRLGAMTGGEAKCTSSAIQPGQPLPVEWGGGVNKWPWAIPRLARNIATKPELAGHFAPEAPDFNLHIPDQIRADVFLRHLDQWKRDRAAGHDSMPAYVLLRLPNDHTAGTTPGDPTPSSSIADNDLAVGRVVEGISHSEYWNDTAFFILEDDAQNGADHVDSHRSIGLVISKYAPHANPGAAAFVDSRFYSTVSMIRTIESLLGVPPMNNNDAFASLISSLFTGPGDQAPFTADTSNRDNGLIYTANKANAPGAAESMKMDFTHADRADTRKLNLILWRDAHGSQPAPAMLLEKHTQKKDDDD